MLWRCTSPWISRTCRRWSAEQSKRFLVTFTVISLLKVMVKSKTYVFQRSWRGMRLRRESWPRTRRRRRRQGRWRRRREKRINVNSAAKAMFQWRVFTTVKWNILFPQGVCLALVVPSGSQSWTIITLGKICLSGFGSALRVPKVNTHHPRGKNLWLKSMIPFFETKNVLHALYWGFNKIPI